MKGFSRPILRKYFYNEEGKHIKTITYKNGEIVKEKIIGG
jgi:hypothetical protein